MNVGQIKISSIVESKANPRRAADADALKDLTASVKEKGVLVPVIVRELGQGASDASGDHFVYELVAGSRRLAAAKAAGLKEIPAQVMSLTDEEAREVAIIENLQREGVHPMDEARAYKGLVTTVKDIAAVAAKVGKSAAYVRARLNLVQLCGEAEKAYRDGKISDGHAVEIAKLSPAGDQQKAVTWISKHWKGAALTTDDLKRWVEETFGTFLKQQPWLKDPKAMEAVGECKECPKNTDTLFGPETKGACVSVKCWRRKMDAFLKWKLSQKPGSVLVSTSYREAKGMYAMHQYVKVAAKKCEHAVPGVIAAGERIGSVIAVCVDGKCKTHHPKGNEAVPMTPEEKANAQKEREAKEKREAAEKVKEAKRIDDAIARVTWKNPDAALGVILAAFLDNADCSDVVERRGIFRKGKSDDANDALKRAFDEMDRTGKLRLITDVALDGIWGSDKEKLLKKL